MSTKFARSVLALTLALSALGFATSTALADQPVKAEYPATTSGTLTDVCSFPVDFFGVGTITETDFFDNSGALPRIKWHVEEQDTFIANGKTLIGIPYTFNAEFLFDSSGNLTYIYGSGPTEKIWLPDGSLFVSVGRLEYVHHNATFIISPDKGNPGNIAGFCAALSL